MELIVFIITALVAIAGAVAMLLSENAIHAALFLLLNMIAIAVLYLLLRAPFLFAMQLIIYAGAIIVLFLFVVMLLGAERAEVEQDRIGWQRPVALLMGLLLLGEAMYVFFARPGSALPPVGSGNEDFAAPERISEALFSTYLLPFELTSVLLLAAIVGVVVLNRRAAQLQQREDAAERVDLTVEG
jgi:NADH-quinone oxidoreductase subunit J